MLFVLAGYLAYSSLDLAVWNEHLRQGAKMNEEAMSDLLAFVSVDKRCDMTPQQLADVLNAGRDRPDDRFVAVEGDAGEHKVVHLSFRAKFVDDRLRTVGDVNHREVPVCEQA